MNRPLAIVPNYLRSDKDADLLLRCLVSLKTSAPGLDVLVVDDCSPARGIVDQLEVVMPELEAELVRKPVNSGFSATVNVGLRRALAEGRDAVLVNADMEFPYAGWLEALDARDAWVVGGRLLFPNGLLQHAGIFYSPFYQGFEHRFKFGPADLPEALEPKRCMVTGALQLIRHECLEQIGLYDEGYRLCWEDVDFCLRVFLAGGECIYEPAAVAVHHESAFRSQTTPQIEAWMEESAGRLMTVHARTDHSRWTLAIH